MKTPLFAFAGVLALASAASAQITIRASTAQVLRFQNFPIQTSNAAVTNTVTASLNLPVLNRATVETFVDGSIASTESPAPYFPDWTQPGDALAKASGNFVGFAFVVEKPDTPPLTTWGEAVKTVSAIVPFVKLTEQEAEDSGLALPKPIKSGRAIVVTDIYGNQLAAYTGPLTQYTLYSVAVSAIRSQERMVKLDQELSGGLSRAEAAAGEGKPAIAVAALKPILRYKGYAAVAKAQEKYAALMAEGTAEVVTAMKTYLSGARGRAEATTARTVFSAAVSSYPQTEVAKLATDALTVVAGGKISPALQAALSAPTTQPAAQQVATLPE